MVETWLAGPGRIPGKAKMLEGSKWMATPGGDERQVDVANRYFSPRDGR